METEGVAEVGGVEVAAAAGVVGEVEGVADVEAEDEQVDVVTEADAGA